MVTIKKMALGQILKIKDLINNEHNFSVLYLNNKYKICQLTEEKEYVCAKLVSLNLDKIIVIILVPKDFNVLCSNLSEEKFLLKSKVEKDMYLLENENNSKTVNIPTNINLTKWLHRNKKIYVDVYTCFEETFIGDMYITK